MSAAYANGSYVQFHPSYPFIKPELLVASVFIVISSTAVSTPGPRPYNGAYTYELAPVDPASGLYGDKRIQAGESDLAAASYASPIFKGRTSVELAAGSGTVTLPVAYQNTDIIIVMRTSAGAGPGELTLGLTPGSATMTITSSSGTDTGTLSISHLRVRG